MKTRGRSTWKAKGQLQVGRPTQPRYLGLASFTGALEAWDDLPEFVEEVYRAREIPVDREVPERLCIENWLA